MGISGFTLRRGKTSSRLLFLSRVYNQLYKTPTKHTLPRNGFETMKKLGGLCEKKFKTKQITPNDIIQDNEINTLMRLTWMGELILTASELYQTIYEKNSKNDDSIKNLLKVAPSKITFF